MTEPTLKEIFKKINTPPKAGKEFDLLFDKENDCFWFGEKKTRVKK